MLDDFAEAIAERVKHGGLYTLPTGTEGLYVATVRAIVQQASLSPAMARRKVFIIGDAERMVPQEGSEQAANAFLKLLEEPPADTTLILTSSESGALLPTVRSRVVAVRVPRLSDEEVRAWLEDEAVARAIDGERLPRSIADRVAMAEGAPGLLLSGGDRRAALETARRLLEAATSGNRGDQLRLAAAQGSSKARGAFSDTLDALTELLRERARDAVRHADARQAVGAGRAVDSVERAKLLTTTNVSPQLVSASLLRELSSHLG